LAEKPRILVLTGTESKSAETPGPMALAGDVVETPSLPEALALMKTRTFEGMYISAQDQALWQQAQAMMQNEAILEVLGEGVAILQPDSRILWANATFERWCDGPAAGRLFLEALAMPAVLGPDLNPLSSARQGSCVQTRLQRRDQFLELRLAPILDSSGNVQQIIALLREISSEVRKQQKLDALHQAGRGLACLQSDLSAEDRIEVLKHNIRNLTHNLLHYDVIEIRLLDPATKLLKPLLAEGMTQEAAERVLYAKTEGTA